MQSFIKKVENTTETLWYCRLLLLNAYFNLESLVEAQRALKIAKEKNLNEIAVEAKLLLATVFYGKEDYASSLNLIQEIVEENKKKDDLPALWLYRFYLSALKKPIDMIENHRYIIYMMYAKMALETSQLEKAETTLVNALNDTQKPILFQMLANIYNAQDNSSDALCTYRRAYFGKYNGSLPDTSGTCRLAQRSLQKSQEIIIFCATDADNNESGTRMMKSVDANSTAKVTLKLLLSFSETHEILMEDKFGQHKQELLGTLQVRFHSIILKILSQIL
jgi:tetratricopeptide (TPR) repeat protein